MPDPQKSIENVGRRVAELREDAGLTQEQFAEVVGMQVQNVRMIESGRRNLTIRSLARIATALKCEIAAMFAPATRAKRKRGRPRRAGAADPVRGRGGSDRGA